MDVSIDVRIGISVDISPQSIWGGRTGSGARTALDSTRCVKQYLEINRTIQGQRPDAKQSTAIRSSDGSISDLTYFRRANSCARFECQQRTHA